MSIQQRYIIGSWAYGLIRTLVYAPPMRENEYVTDRIVKVASATLISPCIAPVTLAVDVHNLEHKLRKMPGDINRTPWQ